MKNCFLGRILAGLLALVITLGTLGINNAEAATVDYKYLYGQYVLDHEEDIKAVIPNPDQIKGALVYINNDSIPELVIGEYNICTIRNGKVVDLKEPLVYSTVKYKKKSGLYRIEFSSERAFYGDREVYWTRLKNGKGKNSDKRFVFI